MPALDWMTAWQRALYGEHGFYRQAGPAAHFETATHGAAGAVLARALLTLARREGLTRIVDVGAGRGELLSQLAAQDESVRLTGVDVVPAPADLPARVEWLRADGGATLAPELAGLTDALVLAHEWLDVVPCPVAQVDPHGVLRLVLVDAADGTERLGGPLTGPDLAWARHHWPAGEPGERVEVGRARDQAWADLLGRVVSGVAIAVDYGHRAGQRPPEGTLTGYRDGYQVAPVPDGSCDITAHVAMDTLVHTELLTQRQALQELGVSGALPPASLASTDPPAYLRGLSLASTAAQLIAPTGYGSFIWAVARLPQAGPDTADSSS